MTTRIKADQDFYVQNEDDLTGSGKTGASSLLATRTAYINPDVGYKSESEASSNTGTFSLIALLKRLLNTTLALGQSTMSNSIRVAIASDQNDVTVYRNTSLSGTKDEITASSARLFGWNLINPNASAVYVKLYNSAAAGVTVGVTTPTLTLMVPASGSVFLHVPFAVQVFGSGMTIVCVTGVADSNTTAPSSAIHVSVRYR